MLLHEGLGCVALWRDIPQRLATETGASVFAYSRFGYGQSDPAPLPRPMTYMHDEALNILPRVLDAASVKHAILVGHSDGGSIAAIYAGAVGDPRIVGLVLIAAHFFVEELNLESIRHIRAEYETTELRNLAWRAITPTLITRFAAGTTPRSTCRSARSTSPNTCPISTCRFWRCRVRMTCVAGSAAQLEALHQHVRITCSKHG